MPLNDDDFFDDDNEKSKTQVKKEMHALQDLGLELSRLSAEQRGKLPLPEALTQAIDLLNKIKSNSAKKRQTQLLGKLLRNCNHEEIKAALEDLSDHAHRTVRRHHLIEQWRDSLMDNDDALGEFITQFPACDRQQLRQLIRSARQEKLKREQSTTPPTGKSPSLRKLFVLVRETLEVEVNEQQHRDDPEQDRRQ